MLHGMAYWRWQVACCYGNSPSYLLTYLSMGADARAGVGAGADAGSRKLGWKLEPRGHVGVVFVVHHLTRAKVCPYLLLPPT